MGKLRTFLARLAAALAVASGTANAVQLSDTTRILRAKGHVVHERVAEWVDPSGFGYAHDHPDVEEDRLYGIGHFAPAFRDERGVLVRGRRWVAGQSGDPTASDRRPDPRDVVVLYEDKSLNVKTTAGIDFIFSQSYNSSAAAQTNGLAWQALSNDSLTETSGSTTLSNEIATNGLSRAKGTYAHSAGTSTATNALTFTATGTQSCQKGALFSASSTGTMMHVLSFTQRTLQTNDTLAITYTITLT